MYYLSGVVGLAFATLGVVGATLAGRYFGARALGVRGIRFFGSDAAGTYFAVPRSRRWIARLAGPLAAYAFAFSLFFLALLGGGRTEATTEVDPIAAGPASAAGIQPGDKVVAIDGRPTTTWQQVRDGVRNSRATLEVRIERQGRNSVIRVTRGPQETIGIAPRTRDVEVPFGEAVSLALTRPFAVMRAAAAGLFGAATGERVSVMGPVGIVREVERSARHRWREYFDLMALLASNSWPASLALELFLTPRRRTSKGEPPPAF